MRVRALGGMGMFILPGTPYGTPSKGRPAISEDRYISEWRDLKEIASLYGMRLFCQLHPSKIQAGKGKKTLLPKDYTIEEIRKIVQAYAEGAQRAKNAGLDGVEIHGAHAHEVAQFLSPFYNQRKDGYGGDLVGRSRFALEIIHSIQEIAGSDFPVIFRFSVEEKIPGGRELSESLQLVRLLEQAGVDAFHTDVGTPEAGEWICPPMEVPPGFSVHLASEVKRIASVPVIAAGRINDLSLAAQIISKGNADLVAMGRALLADPDLPKKSVEDKSDEIRRCIACNQGCRSALVQEAYCLQNPRTGRESTLTYTPVSSSRRKTVLVAGAGPAGLEAACVLAERGHHVKLYEQNSEPGGTFLLASKPPFKEGILEVIRYRMNRLKSLGVEIRLNKKVDLETIEDVVPDVVVAATGSSPADPTFPINGIEAYSPDEVLSGKLPKGQRILVVGGGMVGCEVADHLANHGYRIDIVEQFASAASDLNEARRMFLLERLKKNGIGFILGAKVSEVNFSRATLAIKGRQKMCGDYDSVVYAIGRRSNNELNDALKNYSSQLKVYAVGDASLP
ncbi:MAG: FAD-dependent oxidoreductase, partial [Candidatus Aerophobus sp.]